MQTEQILNFQSLTRSSYLLQKGNPKGRLYILNHGYMSTCKRMWDHFIHRLPEGGNILAANGPYPIPVREGEAYRVGYSWYFYDNFQDYYFVGYEICKDYMKNLIAALGFSENSKTIIGFSQGGYASVHLPESLKNVDHVLGLGCQFNIPKPKWLGPLVVDALHGEDDDVVDIHGAKERFAKLPASARGRFAGFPGVGHKPSTEMLDEAACWIAERAQQKD